MTFPQSEIYEAGGRTSVKICLVTELVAPIHDLLEEKG